MALQLAKVFMHVVVYCSYIARLFQIIYSFNGNCYMLYSYWLEPMKNLYSIQK
jgi:hypothetical protein